MVGLTPYMRCTMCRRVMTLKGVDRYRGCVCGQREFVNEFNPTLFAKLKCWLFRQ